MLDNPVRLVRELKGAPLSIVIVLGLVHQRVTQEYLERTTGYTDKPISQALAYLAEIGMVNHTSAGWQLLAGMQQLPLAPQELEEGDIPTEKTEQESETEPELLNESENISDSITATAAVINIFKNQVNSSSSSRSLSGASRNFSDSEATWEQKLVRDMLSKAGIGEPKLSSLVASGIEPAYTYAHIRQWERQKLRAGILIVRLEQGDRIVFDDRSVEREMADEFPDYFEWEESKDRMGYPIQCLVGRLQDEL